ncbi:ArsR/SmtB family transcription factor [Streptomyces echinatus]|uniref:DNA-binding transcriptional ArsR family regulator n=1 Tax=Streptomyces echinatus TaxID=67293 RepID=A0A7W9Q1J1_9ACTN|nr:DUF5937 family protein [Streptomyces echinatus]MBB5931928.1 DNA-binding transcriptional ArsR family regulator [Streptomyces echinatus]
MLELKFTTEDLALTRLAISPLWEAIASLRVLTQPEAHPLHGPWLAAVRPRLARARLDLRPVTELVTPRVAAFVAPAPVIAAPDIRLELAAMRTHPVEEVQADLDVLGLPRYAEPAAAMERVATTIEAYWELAVAPYWPRIRAVLEADVRHRAHLLSTGGSRQLFSDLDPNLRWEDGRLGVRLRSNRTGTVELDGRGLVLAPSAFAWPRVSLLTTPPWQPLLRYPARGTATIWESRPATPPHALARVIGRPKARLLALLHEPATTTQLAALTRLTVGGASQHLTALRDAGLVRPTRIGRSILYARTETAEALMAEASPH